MKTFIFSLFAVLVLSGCNKKVKSVEYYKEHVDERVTKIKECKENSGLYRGDTECANALSAQIHSGQKIDASNAPDVKKYQNF